MAGQDHDLTKSAILVRRAQGGDDGAKNDLFERYYPRVYHVVRGRMGELLKRFMEPDDIVQETFGVAVRTFDRFEVRTDASLIQWLSRIAENKIRDAASHLNTAKKDPGREVRLTSPSEDTLHKTGFYARELVSDTTAAPDKLARKELIETLHDALQELEEDQRELILLRDFAGGSWDFVAQECGKPSAHAALEGYRRAKAKLAQILGPRLAR